MLDYLSDLISIIPNDEKPYKLKGKTIIPPKQRIVIDEHQIDIFKQFDTSKIPEWKPSKILKPIDEVSMIHLDIETDLELGKFPDDYPDGMWNHHPIVMIGVMDNKGRKIIIRDDSEVLMLKKLFHILYTVKPEILTTFNGFAFDLPYICGRADILGIKHPFQVDSRDTIHKTAQRFNGEPAIYKAHRLTNPDGSHCAVIDLYHQLLSWDYAARKLDKYTLKAAPLALGSRDEPRLDLGGEGIKKCVDEKDWETLKEYLIFDLEDTKDVANYLLPSIYYQQILVDWKLQSIATAGNGSKINDILTKAYGYYRDDPRAPIAEERFKFGGGFTFANTGLYENAMKADVASLYPHIMLYYGIYDKEKDPKMMILSVLKYLLTERLALKKSLKTLRDENDNLTPQGRANDGMQAALKIIINSMYGFLGTQGLSFNSYKCGAMVTAIGRKIVQTMMDAGKDAGCKIATVDTDGVVYSNKTEFTNKEIHEHVQSAMPPGINLDYEWYCELFFVPPNNDKKVESTGLKKCYVMINLWEEQKDKSWKMKKKIKTKGGRYNGRAYSKLDKNFQPQYLSILHNEGADAATKFYIGLRTKILQGKLDYDEIRVNKRIAENETTLPVHLGKPIGSLVSYYCGEETRCYSKKKKDGQRQLLKNPQKHYTETEAYSKEYYMLRVDEMRKELSV